MIWSGLKKIDTLGLYQKQSLEVNFAFKALTYQVSKGYSSAVVVQQHNMLETPLWKMENLIFI